jgi:hypothetical protein
MRQSVEVTSRPIAGQKAGPVDEFVGRDETPTRWAVNKLGIERS